MTTNIDVNWKNCNDNTALQYACTAGYEDIVEQLLNDVHIDVNFCNNPKKIAEKRCECIYTRVCKWVLLISLNL